VIDKAAFRGMKKGLFVSKEQFESILILIPVKKAFKRNV